MTTACQGKVILQHYFHKELKGIISSSEVQEMNMYRCIVKSMINKYIYYKEDDDDSIYTMTRENLTSIQI